MHYDASLGCDLELNAWCNAHCPHAVEHGPLFARLDLSVDRSLQPAWRCYAPATLDDELMNYVGGTTYCTRDAQLRQVMAQCLSASSGTQHAFATKQQHVKSDPLRKVERVVQQSSRLEHDTMRHLSQTSSTFVKDPVQTMNHGTGRNAVLEPPEDKEMEACSGPSPGGRMGAAQRSWHLGGTVARGVCQQLDAAHIERGTEKGAVRSASSARVGVVVAHCHESLHWLHDVQRGLLEGARGAPLLMELHIFEKCGNRTEDACGCSCHSKYGSHQRACSTAHTRPMSTTFAWLATLALSGYAMLRDAFAYSRRWPPGGWWEQHRTYLENKGEECYAYLTYLTTMYDRLPGVQLFFQGDGVLGGKHFFEKTRAFSSTVFRGGTQLEGIWRSVILGTHIGQDFPS